MCKGQRGIDGRLDQAAIARVSSLVRPEQTSSAQQTTVHESLDAETRLADYKNCDVTTD